MRKKLPPTFDADWYAASYPDVALSGLNPREHYRRFGRILGRPPNGSSSPRPVELATPKAEATPIHSPSGRREPAVAPNEQRFAAEPATSAPIIDRPKDFDPHAVLPQPALSKPGSSPDGLFTLDSVVTIPAADGESPSAISAPLQAYARLLNIQSPNKANHAPASVSCGAKAFQAESTRMENAWVVDGSTLRLALAGGAERTADSEVSVLRAYQSHPARPAELHLLGPGIMLPALGPVFHDVELLNPLMPVLLELSAADGTSRAFAMLPFPSLLPGGIHGAELRALQIESNPMDAFWALSEAMLQEAVGADVLSGRSVVSLSVASDQGTDNGLVLSAPFQEWLTSVFGLGVELSDAPAESAGAVRELASAALERGLQLVLPPKFVPTISALVSHRLHEADGEATSVSYLVAEADTYRPRWLIALPADQDFGAAIPQLRPVLTPDTASPPPGATAPIPLAIAVRSRAGLTAPGSVGTPNKTDLAPAKPEALTVLIYPSDETRVSGLIQAIRNAVAGDIEFIVSIADVGSDMRAALDRVCGGEGWREARADADLRAIARDARSEILLTVSDRVEFGDGRAMLALLSLLQHREKAASVSCALLAETIVKKEVVLQPASGGLFPTSVSFVSGPYLSFGEPDVLQALSDLTYPVVANTRHLTAWRCRALADLPEANRAGSPVSEDIRIGLDLTRAGFRNWCTTQVTARLSGSYVARDMIDPVGPGYLPPDRWQDILSRVTVVRELF